jgi:hypothetical protein
MVSKPLAWGFIRSNGFLISSMSFKNFEQGVFDFKHEFLKF